jgi:hypothetical protein
MSIGNQVAGVFWKPAATVDGCVLAAPFSTSLKRSVNQPQFLSRLVVRS